MNNANDTFWILLMLCIYMHVIDDFVLQKPCLCDLKQKSWWEKQIGYGFSRSDYSHDYIMALFMHSVEWAIGMLLPMFLWTAYKGIPFDSLFFWTACCVNTVIHAFVDNMKANDLAINLIEDQITHLVQIVVTLTIFVTRNCL